MTRRHHWPAPDDLDPDDLDPEEGDPGGGLDAQLSDNIIAGPRGGDSGYLLHLLDLLDNHASDEEVFAAAGIRRGGKRRPRSPR